MARAPKQQQQDNPNPNPDTAVMEGFPAGGGEPEPQPEPKPAAVAAPGFDPDAFFDRIRTEFTGIVDSKIGALEAKIQPAAAPAAAPAASGAEDFDTLFFTAPQKALETYLGPKLDSLKTELTSAYKQDRDQLAQAKAEADFWDSFYDKNDDLDRKTDHVFVQGVLQANLGTLSKIADPDKLTEALADKTRDQLLAVSRRFKGGGQNRTEVEGGRGPSAAPAGGDDDNKLVSISQILRDRKKARLKAG